MIRKLLLAMTIPVLLTACGGGGNSNAITAPASTAVTGTSATGKPVVGATIQAKCVAGSPASVTTNANGAFSFDMPANVVYPCVLESSGGTIAGVANSQFLYSLATAAGITHITPLTSLALAKATGTAPTTTWFSGLNSSGIQAVATALATSTLTIPGAPSGFNPFKSPLNPANASDSHDQLLEALKTALDTDGKTLATLMTDVAAGGSLPALPSMVSITGAVTRNFTATMHQASSNSGITNIGWLQSQVAAGSTTTASIQFSKSDSILNVAFDFVSDGSERFYNLLCNGYVDSTCMGNLSQNIVWDTTRQTVTFNNLVLPADPSRPQTSGSVTLNGTLSYADTPNNGGNGNNETGSDSSTNSPATYGSLTVTGTAPASFSPTVSQLLETTDTTESWAWGLSQVGGVVIAYNKSNVIGGVVYLAPNNARYKLACKNYQDTDCLNNLKQNIVWSDDNASVTISNLILPADPNYPQATGSVTLNGKLYQH